ncbi:Glycosyl phosphatidyl inositol protein transamidase complex subunit [Coemansia sp. RSA 2711]|nr:Glycosyl phosphatidyl inositol protein transamidase complex subunit [Coemansia sp. RSA 2711]
MSLVLSGQGEKTSPLLRAARKYSGHLSYLLALLGLCWLLALLGLCWRRAYFSENAMLPGQVYTTFGTAAHMDAMLAVDSVLAAGANGRAQALARAFDALGLDTEVQRFSYDEVPRIGNVSGANVHGILRAPRGDAGEALVVAAAWTTGDGASNVNGVRLLAALAQHAREQRYWARDLVFVVTDRGERGIEAWLRAYLGVGAAPLAVRSGQIQAAISVELPPAQRYDALALYFAGKGGQLCNLDFVNMVQHVSRVERMPALLHGLRDAPRSAHWWARYRQAARLLLRQARAQAFGADAHGVHAPFLRYRIDAVTVAGQPAGGDAAAQLARQGLLADADVPPIPGVQRIGRTVEASLRSLNNLLEHLHQSFFFYLLPANQRYLSIGDYVPACALMIGSLLLQAMHLWWMQGAASLRADAPETRIRRINQSYAHLRLTMPASVQIVVRVLALGLGLLLAPQLAAWAVLSDTTTTAFLFTAALASCSLVLHTADQCWAQRGQVDWRQLKSLAAALVAAVVACLAVMNFSLAVLVYVVAGLPLLVTRAAAVRTRAQRVAGVLLLLAVSPVCTMTLGRNVALGLHPLDMAASPFRVFLGDLHHFGSLVYPLVCLVYWPVNLLSMVIVLMP